MLDSALNTEMSPKLHKCNGYPLSNCIYAIFGTTDKLRI